MNTKPTTFLNIEAIADAQRLIQREVEATTDPHLTCQLVVAQGALTQAAKRAAELALTPEGWSSVDPCGKVPAPRDGAVRHGCVWNVQEKRDVVAKYLALDTVEVIAGRHRRSYGSIKSELTRLFVNANLNVLLDELCPGETQS